MTRNLKRGLLYDKDSHAPNFGMHKCIPYGVERYGGDKIDTHIQTQDQVIGFQQQMGRME